MNIFSWICLSLEATVSRNLDSKEFNLFFFFLFFFLFFASIAEYKILCPGGEGFRPNPITVILEGNSVCFILKCAPFELCGFIYNTEEMPLFSF